MKKLAYSNQQYGVVSIIASLAALAAYLVYHFGSFYVSAALALIGFSFGFASIKTRAGAIGVALSTLAIGVTIFFLFLWVSYLSN